MFELKKNRRVYVIILKVDANFDGKVTCVFINDMRNSVNFTGALKNLTFCTLRDFFGPRYTMFQLKNYGGDVS